MGLARQQYEQMGVLKPIFKDVDVSWCNIQLMHIRNPRENHMHSARIWIKC